MKALTGKSMKSLPIAAGLGLLCACATVTPDHFYVLSSLPAGGLAARTESPTQVILRVSLPALVDRSEMVLDTGGDAVTVLEHERWAAPLAELITQTLAQDFERRRADLLVTGQGLIRPAGAALKVTIDLVRVTMRTGKQASVDVHWRILDTRNGAESLGGDVFNAPLAEAGYAGVARALSDCLGQLADRLVGQLPAAVKS
jgi:uncharacterized lipoprotein YmbA